MIGAAGERICMHMCQDIAVTMSPSRHAILHSCFQREHIFGCFGRF